MADSKTRTSHLLCQNSEPELQGWKDAERSYMRYEGPVQVVPQDWRHLLFELHSRLAETVLLWWGSDSTSLEICGEDDLNPKPNH